MLPSPDDYEDWREYMRALLSGLSTGAITDLLLGDPYAASMLTQAGVGGKADVEPAEGFSPVWLNDDEARLYLGSYPGGIPTAGPLFQVDTTNLANAAITFQKIADGAVDTNHIQLAAISTALIQDAAILSAKIGDAQIVSAKIAEAAVNELHVANAAITSAKIANLAVGSVHIQDAAIVEAKIANASIGTAKIKDAAISTAKIGNAQITTALINDAAVTNAKIANLAVGTANIQNLAVTQGKIGLLAVGTAQIIDASIVGAKIANLAVGNAHIVNAAITAAKIQDLAVTRLKIGNYEVDESRLAEFAVSTAQNISAVAFEELSGPVGWTNQSLNGVPQQITINTSNITGQQNFLGFVAQSIFCDVAGTYHIRLTRNGVAVQQPPALTIKMAAGDVEVVGVFFEAALTPNASHVFRLQYQMGGTGVECVVLNSSFTGMLLKR